MAEKEMDYKEVLTRQKQNAYEVLPIMALMAIFVFAIMVGGYVGVGYYGYAASQTYLHATSDGYGYTPEEHNANVVLGATIFASLVGAIISLVGCYVYSRLSGEYKKELETKYKIKLVGGV